MMLEGGNGNRLLHIFNTEKRERERERVNVGGWESVRPNTQFTGLQ